jgi:hypothetical protein
MDFGAKTTARATQAVISGDIGMFFCAPAAHLRALNYCHPAPLLTSQRGHERQEMKVTY